MVLCCDPLAIALTAAAAVAAEQQRRAWALCYDPLAIALSRGFGAGDPTV